MHLFAGMATEKQRLSTFIREHTEEILSQWESFARGLPIGTAMDVEALRDHAEQMLEVIADDLDELQTRNEELLKAAGSADAKNSDNTPAQEHGAGRAESGFSVGQMVAEFRALRASVLRLWVERIGELKERDLDDLTRFNEAIDQAIAESISRYSENVERAREKFLGILGHDLVTPLGAISTSAKFMLETGDIEEPHLTLLKRIDTSSGRMNRMVADLLDFTRTRFGDGIPIVRAPMDIRKMINDVVSEVAVTHPERIIQTENSGDLRGEWDFGRLAQAVSNLLGNAVQHGEPSSPIRVTGRGTDREVVITIHNDGPAIEQKQVGQLFRAMKPPRAAGGRDRRHLGLGLYIVDKIVQAHGGAIDVESSAQNGTTFTVSLPRAGLNNGDAPGKR
jgi:signal transduction histidine kinase